MKHIQPFEEFTLNESYQFIINNIDTAKVYDIQFPGLPSKKGWKLSLQGKSKKDLIDLVQRVHDFLLDNNIAHKIATKKRIEHPDKEQSKKLITIYVPDSMNHIELATKIEKLLKGYKGWHDIKTPTSYEHFSNAIFFRNDRNELGDYISAK